MDSYWYYVLNVIDLTNRVIVPFTLMFIFSILITYTIFTSRSRVTSNTRSNRTFQKDVKSVFYLESIAFKKFIVWFRKKAVILHRYFVNF